MNDDKKWFSFAIHHGIVYLNGKRITPKEPDPEDGYLSHGAVLPDIDPAEVARIVIDLIEAELEEEA
jgi:hypothetical protein